MLTATAVTITNKCNDGGEEGKADGEANAR